MDSAGAPVCAPPRLPLVEVSPPGNSRHCKLPIAVPFAWVPTGTRLPQALVQPRGEVPAGEAAALGLGLSSDSSSCYLVHFVTSQLLPKMQIHPSA